jgi:hypothetical protein
LEPEKPGENCDKTLLYQFYFAWSGLSRSSLQHPQAKFVYSTKHTFQMDTTTFITIRSQAVARLQASFPLPIVKSRAEELHQSLRESSTRPYLAAVILYLPDLASEAGLGAALSHESPQATLLEAARLCTTSLVSTLIIWLKKVSVSMQEPLLARRRHTPHLARTEQAMTANESYQRFNELEALSR